MINDSNGSAKDNRRIFAGISEHDAIMICPMWVPIPHARVVMQI